MNKIAKSDPKCWICSSITSPYFTKYFHGQYQLNHVEYWQCENCGFVFSQTHYEMSNAEWEELNMAYHSSFQGKDECSDDPRWLERLNAQAASITHLAKLEILPQSLPWLDWGCGDGKLANLLEANQLPTLRYDRYMKHDAGYLTDADCLEKGYGVVINTSVFEHIREIETLESINNLVADDGVLTLHTLVTETIPQDSNWFYLLPVHCSFFTNKSMQILFEKWGYTASIYHVPSRLWFWFRKNGSIIKEIFDQNLLNSDAGFYWKKGFMNYWGVYS